MHCWAGSRHAERIAAKGGHDVGCRSVSPNNPQEAMIVRAAAGRLVGATYRAARAEERLVGWLESGDTRPEA